MKMIRKYGILGMFKLVYYIIYTKMLFRSGRLIRLPIDIRNRKLIKVGKNFTTGKYCRLEAFSHPDSKYAIDFGDNVQINDSVHIVGSIGVKVGNNVLIASKVFITDLSHGSYKGINQDNPHSAPATRDLQYSPVIIEDNVWIGEFVSILPGVVIGTGSVIGTMSVVTKSIPPYTVAVGSPARIIKTFNFDSKQWEAIG